MKGKSKKREVRCICSWCRVILSATRYSWTAEADATTHGLCDRCLSRLERRAIAPYRPIASLRV